MKEKLEYLLLAGFIANTGAIYVGLVMGIIRWL